MDPDDAVDVLEHVDEKLHDEIVREMDPEDAEDVLALEKFRAGHRRRIMTSEVTALYEYLPVDDAIGRSASSTKSWSRCFTST
jgi:Mg/Co/Ni transporter MgtE